MEERDRLINHIELERDIMKTRERGINIQKTSVKQYIERENRRDREREIQKTKD